jgi:KUP system potassium uptake protein
MSRTGGAGKEAAKAGLVLGALGIVFGDIGTSPLYAMKEVFGPAHDLKADADTIYGVLSLVFWSVMIIVSLKYVTLIMRADNEGEGGIMALISLVQGVNLRRRMAVWALVALGVFGASLFYGDGMITPAISVLSAVEGLELAAPALEDFVVPITLAILTTLFTIQRFGTAAVGRLFGPIMLLWFATQAIFGVAQLVDEPSVLRAFSPTYAIGFFVDHGGTAFLALGSVVLAVTGAEALYADMGHFGRSPIRRAWFLLVLPALALSYLGQGALLLSDPKAKENPFFNMVPEWALIPMVVLATIATIIASQAVISGAFSVTRQAVQLGFLPLVTIRHTSETEQGQIYLPVVNWGLFVAIVGLVVGFGSSSALASAYGVAVTGTLAIDTILFFVVVRFLWRKPVWMVAAGVTGFLVVDLAFLSANITKVFHGGWFPLLVGVGMFTLLMTWRRGRDIVLRGRHEDEGTLEDFVHEVNGSDEPPVRVPGTAVFLNPDEEHTPLALRHNVDYNRVLHEHVIVITTTTEDVPHVSDEDRIEIDDLMFPDDGIALVKAHYGFLDDPDVPKAIKQAQDEGGLPIEADDATYFVTRVSILPRRNGGMALWRKKLFALVNRNAASRTGYFNLPEDRVVALGSSIEL